MEIKLNNDGYKLASNADGRNKVKTHECAFIFRSQLKTRNDEVESGEPYELILEGEVYR